MLQVFRTDVAESPFPHVVKEGILPADLFARLKQDFPGISIFEEEHGRTGATGSRVGEGTGFDIYRGDAAYDRLVATSAAWAELDGWINSPAFVETYLATFGPWLDGLGLRIAVEPGRYRRAYVESRETLTPQPTLSDRIAAIAGKLGLARQARTPDLFTRLDIERGMTGYAKPPHCDRANRLCSLIIYFTDLEKEGIGGGELKLYRHKAETVPSRHPRHPDPVAVEEVTSLVPRENLGVFFPCANNSYHGVSAVITQGKARDFLYINISAQTAACW